LQGNGYSGGKLTENRSRYILASSPRKVKGRWMRDVLAYDPDGRRSVAIEVPNAIAIDVLEALQKAYQQGREDNASPHE
jgi:hypothetical protein